MSLFFSLTLLTLLLWAALTDLQARRIPNLASAGLLAAWLCHLALADNSADTFSGLIGGGLVFVAGVALWRAGMLGGGDVKLLAVLALWAGEKLLPQFLLLTTLIGGALALAWLAASWVTLAMPVRVAALLARPGLPGSTASLPYGVAIAAAGVWLVQRLFWS